jgi:hypothetical protein
MLFLTGDWTVFELLDSMMADLGKPSLLHHKMEEKQKEKQSCCHKQKRPYGETGHRRPGRG